MPIAKITSKGRITIPAAFRKRLKSNLVSVEMEGDKIVIRPVSGIGGIFKKFAFKDKTPEEIMEIEEKAIEEAFCQKWK
ncbi:looped-hinge helix DNA binding domain-containing protein, AbrB family [Desulfurobacterium pacificum]|uniref:Looped-hinge helix DNA binding domain-containing protein, AbrB family n=1 Tax=Desulfurobacterium pacificum TaxID=240166 RepID=A0ABY1NET5_9BACT|nr:AbrB/MazE/SpoVT family DNA-binding domain-containing protein [Desulfurobacterium pacificum]SMP07439.1 looped-hinge helix DNA binding domain-containing protein, AbrB family [Desulfurobacterium pacificum]